MFNPAKYIRDLKSEFNKITWPSKREVVISSLVVLVMVIIMSVFFLLVDSLISWVIQLII